MRGVQFDGLWLPKTQLDADKASKVFDDMLEWVLPDLPKDERFDVYMQRLAPALFDKVRKEVERIESLQRIPPSKEPIMTADERRFDPTEPIDLEEEETEDLEEIVDDDEDSDELEDDPDNPEEDK